jgi:hypothetical protein
MRDDCIKIMRIVCKFSVCLLLVSYVKQAFRVVFNFINTLLSLKI